MNGLCIRPESSDDAVSVQTRHHHIAKNEVGLLLFRQIDADAAVFRRTVGKTSPAEGWSSDCEASPVHLQLSKSFS